jgi:hypothetical protein
MEGATGNRRRPRRLPRGRAQAAARQCHSFSGDCGNGCSFYVLETSEQIERCSYFFIVS